MTVGDSSDIPDMRNGATDIQPGYIYDISIKPSQILASKALKERKPHVRKCRLRTENDNVLLFKVLAQST